MCITVFFCIRREKVRFCKVGSFLLYIFFSVKKPHFCGVFAVFGGKVTVKSANCDLFGDFERLASDELAGVFP